MTVPKFIFRDAPTFSWPVTVRYPGDGQMIEATFTAKFAAQDEDELFAKANGVTGGEDKTVAEIIADDRKRLASILRGWSGIGFDSGSELAFTPETVEKVLRQRPVRLALGEAYAAAMIERTGARVKNSGPLPE